MPKGSPLWRIAGYIYETVISGSVTIFSAKGSSLMVSLIFSDPTLVNVNNCIDHSLPPCTN